MLGKTKNLGQVHTPQHIVEIMLNQISYFGKSILKKHIIDNSCGDGAFLKAIAQRYIAAYLDEHKSIAGIKHELETYIHGIEIDESEFCKCLSNMDSLAFLNGLPRIDWNILNDDSLKNNSFDNKMDFVVANPPYIRIHNLLENFEKVRNYKFSRCGMTDMFLVFYDIGFRQLNESGKLCYITPNSFYSSLAGKEFRNFIVESKNLVSLIDLGHYQPFKAVAYTTICCFDVSKKADSFSYSTFDKSGKVVFQENLTISDAFNNGNMILAKRHQQDFLKRIQNYFPKDENRVKVKNAFATLADSIFIKKSFSFSNSDIIPILKASTSEWKQCIFPYRDSSCLNFDDLAKETQEYLLFNRLKLETRSLEKPTQWYAFGRTQAIKDVDKNKIAINTTVKDISSIKLNVVNGGCGIYSGLYILTDEPFDKIESIIKSEDFISYIKTIGKCKNGGYYTFSSKELKQFLLYKLQA